MAFLAHLHAAYESTGSSPHCHISTGINTEPTPQMETYKSVTTCRIQKKTSEADPFKNTRVITPYTPEDGHIGRNM
jgi:hypothetical protein